MPINCFEFQVCRAGEPCNCNRTGVKAATLYNVGWLKRCARNPTVLSAFRGVAKASGKSLLDNESLFRFMAGQIASGELRVCQRLTAGASGDPGQASNANASIAKPFPFSPKPKASTIGSWQPPQNDPQTLPDDLDAAAQAAALSSAATQAAPFCPE